ncbi:VanZ family protein [Lederbergia lenta]|uniref:VanZ family protein n=1 Tax=Lederbergia lenta TaxID=1467 RepID=A0A2X4WVW9_LEDLE|nr:VanZ family protein [Lederbergia lenta]MEC2323066.1 VanZ family protein [Lederbergia lenta]SQI62622.1 VanZ family protein [Lederbergia lenta]
MKTIIKVFLLPVVAISIFIFSSQTYEQQSLVPMLYKILPGEPLIGLLSHIEIPYWGSIISVETKGYYYFLEFLIRKFAHLFLFGMFALTMFSLLMFIKRMKVPQAVFIALIGTGIYAAVDEYHQLITGGRTPLVADVLLDMTGAVIALVIYVPIYMIRKRINN